MNKVFITGMGVVSPIGTGKDLFWNSLSNGRHGFGPITLFDASSFPCRIAAEVKHFDPTTVIDKKKAKRLDRFVQFALVAAAEAIKDAGLDITEESRTATGVIVGTGTSGISTLETQHSTLLQKGAHHVSPFGVSMTIPNAAAAEVALTYGLEGPCYATSSACASSAHAIGAALAHLRLGEADVMIVGGAEAAISPLSLAGFCKCGAIATEFNDTPAIASRPFDANRRGFVMGEGAGIFVLETEAHARKRGARVYAELAGYAATDDAHHITMPRPDGKSVIRAMAQAIERAGLTLNDIDYINAHGTSTQLNDQTETAAIKALFGDRAKQIPCSSTKSMSGHLLGAAGAIELIATVLCMKNQTVHPTINYETADPGCDLDYVPNQARPHAIRNAMSNSFGFGGHNGVVVLKNI